MGNGTVRMALLEGDCTRKRHEGPVQYLVRLLVTISLYENGSIAKCVFPSK